jgi:hypothetical protein
MPTDVAAIIERVPLCGCGSPSNSWGIVLEILDRAVALSSDLMKEGYRKAPSFYDPAADASARWVEFVAHVLGEPPALLLEHGTSIGYAWPTKDGRKLHAFLVAHGTDPNMWPRRQYD